MHKNFKIISFFTLIILTFFCQASDDLMERILTSNSYKTFKISPDGNHFAMTYQVEDKINLSIFDISSKPMKPVSGVKLGGDLSVGRFYWANNSRIIYSVLISESWYNEYKTTGEMFGIDIDGENHDVIFGQRAANNKRRGTPASASKIKGVQSMLATFELVHILPNDKEHVLITATSFDTNDTYPKVYKLNIYDGNLKKVSTLPMPLADAVADINGTLKYAYGKDKTGKIKLYEFDNNEWKLTLDYYGDEGGFSTLSILEDRMFIIDESEDDLTGLYEVNIKTNEKSLLYQNDVVDLTNVELNPNSKKPYLVETNKDKFKYHYFSESDQLAKTHQQLTKAFKGNMVDFLSFTENLDKLIFKVSSDKIVGDFYLFDRVKKNAAFLVSQKPNLKLEELASMQPITFENRNGQSIHGYFTKATHLKENEVGPLVVMPHGGPYARDYWGFDSQVQTFATNGLSVLQVNFTGSTGYGKKFLFDGYKHWGDVIQDDITDGTRWAINNKMAKADNICIYGFSFGAYSALMGVEKEPDLYQCAAAGGVYDLSMMYKAKDFKNLLWGQEYLKSAIGQDEKILNEFSPINHTDKIKVPVFLAHGKNDTRVPVQQTKNLVKKLKKSGVKFDVNYFAKEPHGFYDINNRIKFNTQLLDFLKKNLKL